MNTYGIAFFATPHRGGNYATLGTVVSNIVNKTTHKPPSKLIEALQRDSSFLEKLDLDFRHQLEAFFYVSFFETRYHGVLDMVSVESGAR